MANDDTLNEDEGLLTEEELQDPAHHEPAEDLGSEVHERYLSQGKEMLSDSLPSQLDPRVIRRLEPILGDVGHVRVHTGEAATAAARAMDARAFAVGDGDVFIDQRQYNPGTERGDALLAHEVAHTMDAATGFAMSSERSEGDGEEFAREVEMAFAQEDVVPTPPPETIEPPRETGNATTVEPGEPKVDLWALEQRVVEVLEQGDRSDRERGGH